MIIKKNAVLVSSRLMASAVKLFLLVGFSSMSFSVTAQELDTRMKEREVMLEDNFVRAQLFVIRGKTADAIKLLDTLRRENNKDAAIALELAKLNYSIKDIQQTEKNLNLALSLAPNNRYIKEFEVYYNKRSKRYPQAMAALQTLISLYPNHYEYYEDLVEVALTAKEYDIGLLAMALKEKNLGFMESTVIRKAELFDKAGKPEEAVKALETLMIMFPNEKKYPRLITSLLHSNDMTSEVEPYLKRILVIDPNDIDAKLGLLLFANRKLNTEEFLVTLTPMISNPDAPINLKIKELLPYVTKHAETKDTMLTKSLIRLCDALVIAHPNEAKAHAIYADVLMNADQINAAIRQYEKTLVLDKKNFLVWEQLMYALEWSENWSELGTVATDAIDYFPNQAINFYFSARSMVEGKMPAEAMSLADEAVLIAAEDPNLLSKIDAIKAAIMLQNNKPTDALKLVKSALAISQGKNAYAHEVEGDIYYYQKDNKKAAESWNLALKANPKSKSLNSKLSSIKNN